ncbi:MAG: branched-chain amino acid transaminase [Thermoleophilia bacterium]
MPIPVVDKIWMNGELVPWADAKVHVLTHALHYGSGVFEGIRCYDTVRGPAVFRLDEHMARLERSAKLYYMPVPYTREELSQATKDLIKANGLRACYIRPLVFRGYGEMGIFPLNAPVETIIAAWPWGAYLGDDAAQHGIRAKCSSVRALDNASLARAAKACGQYLNSILAKVEVNKAGYDEAIMLNERGHVAEGSGENIFAVRRGVLMTPPVSDGILEGITRETVIEIAASLGIPCTERTLTRSDLVISDELFCTGTAAELVPIREVDDHVIGEPGPVTRRIQEKFHAIVSGRDDEFAHYMEAVEG